MAKHTAARIGLLALLVFAVFAQVSADADIEEVATGVLAALSGSRSDATACWKGTALTCAASAQCAKTKCTCCACPCDSAKCLSNSLKASYKTVEQAVNSLKTAAQRKAAAPGLCALSAANAKALKAVTSVYMQIKCPGYAAVLKSLKAQQANYAKWCKAFSA